MKRRLLAFFEDVDASLRDEAAGETLAIYHIGRSALVWKYEYVATTQDVDILRPIGGERLLQLALGRFGRDTPKARTHGLYLEVVERSLPPVAPSYQKRAVLVAAPWHVLRLYHLDPHDLAVTKLRRFSPKDREDIRMLCDLDELDPERLEAILETAFYYNLEKDGDEFRDAAFRSLGIVQQYLRGDIDEF